MYLYFNNLLNVSLYPGPPRGLGGPRANTKSGAPQNGLCEGGLGGMPLGNFEILHTLKCVLGAPEAFFCVHAHTCKLPSSISGFR